MKKPNFTIALFIILALTIPITAYATATFVQSRMTVFTGHIAHRDIAGADDVTLSLRVCNKVVGQNGSIANKTEVFPILEDVQGIVMPIGDTTDFSANWTSKSSESPILSQKFILTANGDMENLTYRVEGTGAGINPALRFGVTYGYFNDTEDCNIIFTGIKWFDMGSPGYGATGDDMLGDGNIAKGEQIIVQIACWVDAKDLQDDYSEENFTIDVIFAAEPAK